MAYIPPSSTSSDVRPYTPKVHSFSGRKNRGPRKNKEDNEKSPHSTSGSERGRISLVGPTNSAPAYHAKAFEESVKLINRLEKVIDTLPKPLVGTQPSPEQIQLTACALQHLSKGARYPIFPNSNMESMSLPVTNYRPNDKSGYYRASGGSIVNIYEDHVLQNKYRLKNGDDFVTVVKSNKVKRIMKGAFEWISAIPKGSDYLEFAPKDSKVAKTEAKPKEEAKTCLGELTRNLDNLANAKESKEHVFLDVSRVLNIAPQSTLDDPTVVQQRIQAIRQKIREYKHLNGAKVGGFFKLQDGQWAFILFTSSCQHNKDKIHDFTKQFFQIQALGYKPDFMQIKIALARQGYNLQNMKKEYRYDFPKKPETSPERLLPKADNVKQYALDLILKDFTEQLNVIFKPLQRGGHQPKIEVLKMLHTFLKITAEKIEIGQDQQYRIVIIMDALQSIADILTKLKPDPQLNRDPKNNFDFLKAVDLIMEEITLLQTCTSNKVDLKGKLKNLGTVTVGTDKLTPQVELYTSGMNAFSQLVIAHHKALNPKSRGIALKDRKPLTVYSSEDCYYELNNVFGANFKNYGRWKAETKFDAKINVDEPNIVIADLYPNNARAKNIRKVDFLKILPPSEILAKRKDRPLTLVIDVSTTSVNDEKVQEIIKGYKEAIDAGALNLVILSSLAKFTQCGFDKHNGGMILSYNNGSAKFRELNLQLQKFAQEEPMALEAQKYFEMFFESGKEIKDYIKITLERTNKFYDVLNGKSTDGFKTVKTTKKEVVKVAERDTEIPIIGLQFEGILDLPKLSYPSKLNLQIVIPVLMREYLVLRAHHLKLPLNKRSSFPFQHTNVNACRDALRLTVGIEDDRTFEQYSTLVNDASAELNKLLGNPKETDTICAIASSLQSEKEIDKVLSDPGLYAKIIEDFTKKPTLESLAMGISEAHAIFQKRKGIPSLVPPAPKPTVITSPGTEIKTVAKLPAQVKNKAQ